MNPRVALEPLEEFLRAVIGITIANDQLPVRDGLRENGFHPFGEIRSGIQIRQTNGDEGGQVEEAKGEALDWRLQTTD